MLSSVRQQATQASAQERIAQCRTCVVACVANRFQPCFFRCFASCVLRCFWSRPCGKPPPTAHTLPPVAPTTSASAAAPWGCSPQTPAKGSATLCTPGFRLRGSQTTCESRKRNPLPRGVQGTSFPYCLSRHSPARRDEAGPGLGSAQDVPSSGCPQDASKIQLLA